MGGHQAEAHHSVEKKQSKMVVTRSLFKTQVRAAFEQLPDELLMEVLAHLKDRDLGVALCTSKRFFACKEPVWREASAKRWPAWYAVAQGSEIPWRRQYEMLSLRERELLVLPSLAAIQKKQTVVNAQNRAVLTEWLAEVRCGPKMHSGLARVSSVPPLLQEIV